MGYHSFEDMPVWQKAMDLAEQIFHFTDRLPQKEDYGLTSQLRRSALSISANLAEGFGREHTRDKLNFYYDSRGSLTETKNHLIYGHRVRYLSKAEFEKYEGLIEEVWKELNSLICSLRKKT